ncbi:hypothetical protein RE428_05860 [Marinobacter nanhaiticus D15-8W]|uniref:2-hydroxymuconate tautomerase n=1 Tax=Marinobacter nanhaiticus D15-8W TaxID=626887 RepID=N6W3Q7_9GAMM|nr:nuclear transport factor 2 family protein [Marinobacter nanhaiticus]ENO14744.2 DUF4440 domain-containing protein [Marinobacter nanhaiticus D15-8W]BES69568.1 hypothetical protein RE428_05860 [Marinobacter nanhaiticus D15-8W]
MPMLQVNLLSGYSGELKMRLMRALTAVIRGTTRAKPEAITVWLNEVDPSAYSRGGLSRQPGPEARDPEALVHDYLEAMQKRDLRSAHECLADDFVMTFPGSGQLSSLRQLVDWAKDRYRYVDKTITSTNVSYEMNKVVVFVSGTLSGEWPDGERFDGVRFIDRFEIVHDRLVRQDVWNDLANTRP